MPPASASLYRRHRPRSFADVVGQEHVVRTLSNAIEQDKVHHAYLFVGSRGTGKTSMAKILAASLNCEHGARPSTPCGVCDSCVSIASATSLDVIEMDAASNNSVDDIRDLREKVAYAPVSGRHKVYILDEAHMLSTAAWNAFLKTLEEPPPHTIFVLATTEANKVLPTVVDRCHRFDFGRPTVAQIAAGAAPRRRRRADRDPRRGVRADRPLGDRLVPRRAGDAGAAARLLRARRSSSPTCSPCSAPPTPTCCSARSTRWPPATPARRCCAAARLADSGRDIGRFFGDLEAHARSLMVVQTLGGEVPPELQVTAEQDERLREQAARVSPTDVVRVLDLIAVGLRAMKDGSDARTQLELALVKAALPKVDASAKALQSRLERLEAGRPAPTPAPPGRPRARRARRPPRAARRPRGRPTARRARRAAPRRSGRPRADGARPGPRPCRPAPLRHDAAAPPPASRSVAAVAVIEPAGRPTPVPAAAASPSRRRPPVRLELDSFAELWPAVIESIQAERPLLAEHLQGRSRPPSLGDGELDARVGRDRTALPSARPRTPPTAS